MAEDRPDRPSHTGEHRPDVLSIHPTSATERN